MAQNLIKSTGEKDNSQDCLTETAKGNGSLKNIRTYPSLMADTCMHHHHHGSSVSCMHLCSGSVFTTTNFYGFVPTHEKAHDCIFSNLSASLLDGEITTGWCQSSTSAKELTWRFFPCCSPQDIYWREIRFRIPRERCGGSLVEMAHQEDPNCADEKH